MIVNRENRETNLNINVTTLFCYTQLKADDVIVYIILVLHTSNVVILYGSLFYAGNKWHHEINPYNLCYTALENVWKILVSSQTKRLQEFQQEAVHVCYINMFFLHK